MLSLPIVAVSKHIKKCCITVYSKQHFRNALLTHLWGIKSTDSALRNLTKKHCFFKACLRATNNRHIKIVFNYVVERTPHMR